jgi:hypothetical protein
LAFRAEIKKFLDEHQIVLNTYFSKLRNINLAKLLQRAKNPWAYVTDVIA